jgi:pyrroline-5-carboxylate reductase
MPEVMIMLAVIGCGEIGTKFLRELLNKKIYSPQDVIATRKQGDDLAPLTELGVKAVHDNEQAVKKSDEIIISLRPQHMDKVLEQVKNLSQGKLVISFAIGLTLNHYKRFLPKANLVRVMPNPFLASHSGVIAFARDANCSEEAVARVKEIFEPLCDKLIELDEGLMHAFTSLASSSSGYFNYFFNAMMEHAVEEGIDESMAKMIILLSAQAAAKEVTASGESFAQLIAEVCTPGGMSIEGIKQLDKTKVKELIKKALEKSTERSKQIEKELS